MAGRREWERVVIEVFVSCGVDVNGRERRAKSNMKFPAARLEGVRGNSSSTWTSYGRDETRSDPRLAIPQGGPSLEFGNRKSQSSVITIDQAKALRTQCLLVI